jgi:hypothetical protein
MARAMSDGTPHRANGALAYHVLEVAMGLLEAAEARRCVEIASSCERPQPLPAAYLQPGPAQ